MQKVIVQIMLEHAETFKHLPPLAPQIEAAGRALVKTLQSGGTIYLCGNGGSAADAQHLAAEFTGRFVRARKGLRAVALTTDTSAITAIANDFGVEAIFVRQLEALARPGDLLIAISTSGYSPNVLEAAKWATQHDVPTIAFTGRDGGELAKLASISLTISVSSTARIQEMHILIGHILCELVDCEFAD